MQQRHVLSLMDHDLVDGAVLGRWQDGGSGWQCPTGGRARLCRRVLDVHEVARIPEQANPTSAVQIAPNQTYYPHNVSAQWTTSESLMLFKVIDDAGVDATWRTSEHPVEVSSGSWAHGQGAVSALNERFRESPYHRDCWDCREDWDFVGRAPRKHHRLFHDEFTLAADPSRTCTGRVGQPWTYNCEGANGFLANWRMGTLGALTIRGLDQRIRRRVTRDGWDPVLQERALGAAAAAEGQSAPSAWSAYANASTPLDKSDTFRSLAHRDLVGGQVHGAFVEGAWRNCRAHLTPTPKAKWRRESGVCYAGLVLGVAPPGSDAQYYTSPEELPGQLRPLVYQLRAYRLTSGEAT